MDRDVRNCESIMEKAEKVEKKVSYFVLTELGHEIAYNNLGFKTADGFRSKWCGFKRGEKLKISGKEARKIGDFDYIYPIVEEIEIKLWPPGYRAAPRFHFGFGIGKTF